MSDYMETFVNKKLDPLFRDMNKGHEAPPILGATVMPDAPIATHCCPLHGNALERKKSAEGWEYVECSQKNCPILLPWDRNLSSVITQFEMMPPTVRQGSFLCGCKEVYKVGVITNANSRNRARCYLSCKTHSCEYRKWIDELWNTSVLEGMFDSGWRWFIWVEHSDYCC